MSQQNLIGDFEKSAHFPTELERDIFLLAFDPRDHVTNTRMTLVAKRVRTWIRPLLYRVIFQVRFNLTSCFPDFSASSSYKIEDIGPFAHHLYISEYDLSDSDDDKKDARVISFLENCPNVQNLVIHSTLSQKVLEHLQNMRQLRKLSADLSHLTKDILLRPAFTQLTHLHLIMKPTQDWITCFFPEAVNLTHFGSDGAEEWEYFEIEDILSLCPKLLALVLFEEESYTTNMDIRSMHIKEPRVVLFVMEILPRSDSDDISQWVDDVQGGYDFWDMADLFIIARRAGYFNSDCVEHYSSEAIDVEFEWGDNLTDKGRDWFKTVQRRFPYISFVRY